MLRLIVVGLLSVAASGCPAKRERSDPATVARVGALEGRVVEAITLPGEKLFPPGSATLWPSGRELLRETVGAPRGGGVVVQVFGDGRNPAGCGGREGAMHLSRLRAESIAGVLRSQDGGEWTVLEAVGRGYARVGGVEADRRVVVWVVR